MILRCLLASLIPLLAACQSTPPHVSLPMTRVQGPLILNETNAELRDCQTGQRYQLKLTDNSALQEALQHFAPGEALLLDAALVEQDNQARVQTLYRVASQSSICRDDQFKKLNISASGNEPFWNIRLTKQGLILTRPDAEPLALPYLEEQLPNGRIAISSEANNQRLTLWLSPQLCTDSMSGAVSHLTAHLSLDQQQFKGCAYFGGARQ